MPIDPRMVKWDGPADSGRIDPRMVKWEGEKNPEPEKQPASKYGWLKPELPIADIAAGLIRGAGSIGSTILAPIDYASQNLPAWLKPELVGREDRRESLDPALQSMGADPSSTAYKGGKLAAEIAGTAGAGGRLAEIVAAVPKLASLAPVIESGGFSLGNAATGSKLANAGLRTLGGAVQGGISAGLVDPEYAGTGAVIGGAVPMGAKTAAAIGSTIKKAAGGLAKNVLGATTGTGAEAVGAAYRAGQAGNKAFTSNMRGTVDMTDVLDDAKAALGRIRDERSMAYRSGMAGVKADKAVLDLAPVLKSADDAMADTMYKGVVKKENAAKMAQKIKDVVDEWGGLNPSEFHTPEGLDALKQRIGDLRDATSFGTPERRVADGVYNAIKRQIQGQAPEYSKVMKDYSEASELISEIERSLVGKEKTSVDTAMRRLQSLMRNNVNTNYGNRLNLAGELEKRGADIIPAVAGQAMSSATPRGLQGLAATGTGIYGLANPWALTALPFQSPRLVGEAAYGLGRLSGGANNAVGGMLNRPPIAGIMSNPANAGLMTTIPAVSFSR